MKNELEKLKRAIVKKHKSLSRFAVHIGMTPYELSKLLNRIRHNRGIYITDFDSQKMINELKQKI